MYHPSKHRLLKGIVESVTYNELSSIKLGVYEAFLVSFSNCFCLPLSFCWLHRDRNPMKKLLIPKIEGTPTIFDSQ